MLSRGSFKQHHVISLPWGCGLFGRHDLLFHSSRSSGHSTADAAYCRPDHRDRRGGYVPQYPHCDDYSCGHWLLLELPLFSPSVISNTPIADAWSECDLPCLHCGWSDCGCARHADGTWTGSFPLDICCGVLSQFLWLSAGLACRTSVPFFHGQEANPFD